MIYVTDEDSLCIEQFDADAVQLREGTSLTEQFEPSLS